MLVPTFKGSEIRKDGGNNNLGQLDVTRVSTRPWTRLRCSRATQRNAAWGNVDKMIMAQAPVVPFIWDKTTLIWSKDVNGLGNPYNSLVDLTFTSLK